MRIKIGLTKDGRPRYAINELGKRHGKLKVLKLGPQINGCVAWICKCDCGTILNVRAVILRCKQLSCGCLQGPNRALPKGEASLNRAFGKTRAMAIRFGHQWSIAKSEYKSIVTKNCHYCGKPPAYIIKNKYGNFKYHGLDRLNSLKEYTVNNVVSCYFPCNRMKGNMNKNQFIKRCQKILKNLRLPR